MLNQLRLLVWSWIGLAGFSMLSASIKRGAYDLTAEDLAGARRHAERMAKIWPTR